MVGPIRALLAVALSTAVVAQPPAGQASAPMPPMTVAPLAGDQPLSVMTYNVKGLPWPVALGREPALARIAERLATLRRMGRQPHIVMIQEAFVPEAAALAARAGYPYAVAGPDAALRTPVAAGPDDIAYLNRAYWHRGEQVSKPVSSGLLILSDYPITASARFAFPDFACAGFDCLANKGVLVAHLRVPGIGAVSMVNTHLNARGAAGVPIGRSHRAFDRQVALFADFVRAEVPADRPLVVGGDVNIGSDPARSRTFFKHFARAGMDFIAAPLGGVKRVLGQRAWADAQARRDLAHADEHGADWLFARDARGAPMPVASGRVPFGLEASGDALSDHYGYEIGYTLTAATT